MPKLTDDVFEGKLKKGKSAADRMVDTLSHTPDEVIKPISSADPVADTNVDLPLDLEAVEKTYKTTHKIARVPRTYYLDSDLADALDASVKSLKALGKQVDRSQIVNDALRNYLAYLHGQHTE